jgi:NitT/TauT family transport system permease protein
MDNRIRYKKLLLDAAPFASVALFLAVWAGASAAIGAEIILPAPRTVFSDFSALLSDAEFWRAIGGTLMRTLVSFSISFGLALLLSVVAFLVPAAEKALSPLVTIARATPTMSIILLSLIWLTSATSPILIACLIIFPLLYSDFCSALKSIDPALLNMARLYRVRKADIVLRLFIPGIAPSALDAMRSGISLNMKVLIAAEVLAQTAESIGLKMQIARMFLDTADLLAWTAAAILLSYALEFIMGGLKKILIRWRQA